MSTEGGAVPTCTGEATFTQRENGDPQAVAEWGSTGKQYQNVGSCGKPQWNECVVIALGAPADGTHGAPLVPGERPVRWQSRLLSLG